MDISSSAATAESHALLAATLAKKQQRQEGEAVLALLQTATQSATQSAPVAPTSASAALGSRIDIRV